MNLIELLSRPHNLIILSVEPVRALVPSGEKAIETIRPTCHLNSLSKLPLRFQSRTIESKQPVSNRVPSGEKTTALTVPVYPLNSFTWWSSTSHTLTVLSSEPAV